MTPIGVRNFSHVSVHVADMERAKRFYVDLLGLKVLFDVALEGPGLEAVTLSPGAKGRMVGCLVPGGAMIELVEGIQQAEGGGLTDGTNDSLIFSLCVEDLDSAYRSFELAGIIPLQRPADVGGVRMFFVRDPDGRRIEFIQFPGDASRAAELHGYRG